MCCKMAWSEWDWSMVRGNFELAQKARRPDRIWVSGMREIINFWGSIPNSRSHDDRIRNQLYCLTKAAWNNDRKAGRRLCHTRKKRCSNDQSRCEHYFYFVWPSFWFVHPRWLSGQRHGLISKYWSRTTIPSLCQKREKKQLIKVTLCMKSKELEARAPRLPRNLRSL